MGTTPVKVNVTPDGRAGPLFILTNKTVNL
jgi:hypothetical protein